MKKYFFLIPFFVLACSIMACSLGGMPAAEDSRVHYGAMPSQYPYPQYLGGYTAEVTKDDGTTGTQYLYWETSDRDEDCVTVLTRVVEITLQAPAGYEFWHEGDRYCLHKS